MNDRHPSGDPNPADSPEDFSYTPYEQSAYAVTDRQDYGPDWTSASDNTSPGLHGEAAETGYGSQYTVTDGYPGGAWEAYGYDPYASWSTPASGSGHDYGTYTAYDVPAWTSQDGYDHPATQSSWETGTFDTAYGTYDTGTYDTSSYATGEWESHPGDTGAWDTSAWQNGQDWNTGQWHTGQWETGQWETGQWEAPLHENTGPHTEFPSDYATEPWETPTHTYDDAFLPSQDAGTPQGTAPVEAVGAPFSGSGDLLGDTTAMPAADPGAPPYDDFDALYASHQDDPDADRSPDDTAAGAPAAAPASPTGSRGRRRSPKPRRSALLTVAVPSVAVLGVTGAAAASVMGGSARSDETPQAQDDPAAKPVQPSKANQKLDAQFASLSSDANDFADRANRTQERIDLKKRQEEERKRKAAEAARKEAMRPKFALPVEQKGLSATFGSAGVNWLSLHSGIDFPVDTGTPVKAATDGTITAKWDFSFGNMAVVTAEDGTETWYCHLSSTKIRSGEVKAGDTIGYSGTTGNSTGPHLHFEVHPGGGSAIDPLPWLRGKGLEPQ